MGGEWWGADVVRRARDWWSRARQAEGHERQTLAMIGKSALAATAAWYVASDVLATEAPAFAPFSAILVMQMTVYRSALNSLRFVAAVCAGVAIEVATGFLVGPNVGAFATLAVISLAIGRWPRLVPQGSQVATAAFFAFSLFVTAHGTTERLINLGMIILLVLIGCGIGLVVNLLVWPPPLRYRGGEYGVRTFACALYDLMAEIAETLRDAADHGLDGEDTAAWRRRANQLWPVMRQAQAAVQTARESQYYNPRRLWIRHGHWTSFADHEQLIEALARIADQIGSLTRSLDRATDDAAEPARRDFLRQYADLMTCLSQQAEILGNLDDDRLVDLSDQLVRAAEDAEHRSGRLAAEAANGDIPLSDPARPYGLLLIEATRLTEEFRHTADVLQAAAGQARAASSEPS